MTRPGKPHPLLSCIQSMPITATWLVEVAGKHRNLSVQPWMTAKSIIAVTQDKGMVTFLTEVGHLYNGNTTKLMQITKENKQNKSVHQELPFLPAIEDHPNVLWAKRSVRHGTQDPKNQVTAGDPPAYLKLLGIHPYKVLRYVGKPAFCGNCQKWRCSVAVRSREQVWVLFQRSQHATVQGESDERIFREVSTEVLELLSRTQCMENQMSLATELTLAQGTR